MISQQQPRKTRAITFEKNNNVETRSIIDGWKRQSETTVIGQSEPVENVTSNNNQSSKISCDQLAESQKALQT